MVDSTQVLNQIITFFSDLFYVQPEWLIFPGILTLFFFPLTLNIFAIYYFMEKIVKVFSGTGMNLVIAGLVSFLMLPYNDITRFITPIIVGYYLTRNNILRILFILIIYGFAFSLPEILFYLNNFYF